MQEYPIMFVLKDGSCPKYASKYEVSADGSPRHINFISCIESDLIPIYEDKVSTRGIQVSGMFSQYGNIILTKLTKNVCAAIEVGVKRDVALFYLKNQMAIIREGHPEVTDSAVRENIAYYVDICLEVKGLEITNIEDF